MLNDSTEASSFDFTSLVSFESAPKLLGEYRCDSLGDVNSVLEAALKLSCTHNHFLVPCLSEAAGSYVVTLNFAVPSALSPEKLSLLELPKDLYQTTLHVAQKGRLRLDSASERLHEGWSSTLKQHVDIAITHYYDLPACNSALQAVFITAGLKHENVCEVRDVRLCQGKKAGVKMRVERELTKRRLDIDLLERQKLRSLYPEVALLDILGQICAALLHAQRQVNATQGLADSDITPAMVYVATHGMYKLSGACFSVERSDTTQGKQSRSVMSLGRTVLQLATLDPTLQQHSGLRKMPYSQSLKDLISSMLREPITLNEVTQSISPPSFSVVPTTPADVPLAKFSAAKQLKSQRAYAQAAALLAEAWRGYLDRGDPQAVEVGAEFGHLLAAQVSDFDGAKAVITHVHQLTAGQHLSIPSKLMLIEAAFFMQEYDQAVCQIFALFTASLSPEQYLSLCFYLAECYWSSGRKSEVSQVTESVVAQHSIGHSTLYQVLLLHLQAREQECGGCWAAAAALRSQVQRLVEDESCFPLNLLRVVNLMDLALAYECLSKLTEALTSFEQADSLLREYPASLLTGRNLYNWGNALRAVSNLGESLRMYERAEEVLAKKHATCLERGLVLSNWGLSLAALSRLGDAGEVYALAEALFSAHYPACRERARNLMNWGALFELNSQYFKCPELYERAHGIFSLLSTTSEETGLSIFFLGKALVECSRPEDAVGKLATAYPILTRLGNVSLLEQNTYYWGRALASADRASEALEKYKESYELWAGVVDSTAAAKRLVDWGNCLFSLGKYALAIEKYEAADTVLGALESSEANARNLYNWANALACQGLLDQAVDKHQQSHDLLLSLSPSPLLTAQNLLNWGRDLCELKAYHEAVKKFALARTIFKRELPRCIDECRNLMNLGVALLQLCRSKEALKIHELAHSLLSTRYPDSLDTAFNLLNWANALCSLQIFAAALEKYQTADTLLVRLSPTNKERGMALHNWGNALFDAGKVSEACDKYSEAEEISRGKYVELEERNREHWKLASEICRTQENSGFI